MVGAGGDAGDPLGDGASDDGAGETSVEADVEALCMAGGDGEEPISPAVGCALPAAGAAVGEIEPQATTARDRGARSTSLATLWGARGWPRRWAVRGVSNTVAPRVARSGRRRWRAPVTGSHEARDEHWGV